METSEMEELFWQVFNCDGEEALHKIVTNNEYFKNPDNWYPYGGDDKDDKTNFRDFENQQPKSGAALVEKITNSIDALLLKRCKQEGMKPESPDAPRTIEGATERFFNIPKGEIGELQGEERAQMARDNIQIIATGGDNPDLMIYDCGEGQHPDNFKNTFLSIGKGNKADIAFVQGKYNMGATGAVTFCGEYRYQLIASKMNQEVFDIHRPYAENLFGWTLVRKHILTDEEDSGYKYAWYEYFAIGSEKIPQFAIDEIDIRLSDNKKFATGSFVKLFSYEMPEGQKTAIHQGLYREFTQLLYKPALPFLLCEKRLKYEGSGGIKEIAVYGNHVRINGPTRDRDLLERSPIYVELKDEEMGTVTVQAIVLKKGENKQQQDDRKRNYIGRGRNIIYVLNGQVQGIEGQSFITQYLKYNFLKNSMLVVIDCSKTRTNFRQDVFMANRSHLKRSNKLDRLNARVIEELKGNEILRQLNSQRKDSILQGGDDSEEKEMIENLFSKMPMDKVVAEMLGIDGDIANLFNQTAKSKSEKHEPKKSKPKPMPLETKRFPSIFKTKLKENQEGKKIKSIPLGGKGIIQFETNVDEDYFYRPQEKGELEIQILDGKRRNDSDNPNPEPTPEPTAVKDIFEISQSGPSDGSIKLTLKPKADLNVGEEIKLNARLTSPDGDMESIFYVKIVDPQKQENKKVEKEPERPAIPKLIKITKTDTGNWEQDNGEIWNEDDWSDDSVIHIILGDGEKKTVEAIAINMSNNSLQKYLSKNQAKSEQDINYLRKQYVSKIYLHGFFLYSVLEKMQSQERQENRYSSNESSEDLVAKIFKDYGKILPYLDVTKEILDSFSDED